MSKIQPLKGSLGRRTRFLIYTVIGAVQIYLKKPLDVSIVFSGQKLDFPKPSFWIIFFIYFGKPKRICDEVTFLFNIISRKIIIIEHGHNFINLWSLKYRYSVRQSEKASLEKWTQKQQKLFIKILIFAMFEMLRVYYMLLYYS